MHLFAYGTLTFPKIWMRIVGREFQSAPATVAVFAVYRAKGEVVPVMVRADRSESVGGRVYFDLDDSTIALVDRYESKLYERIEVEATLDDGRAIACGTYVLPERRRLASGERWDAQWFEREAMADYLRRLK